MEERGIRELAWLSGLGLFPLLCPPAESGACLSGDLTGMQLLSSLGEAGDMEIPAAVAVEIRGIGDFARLSRLDLCPLVCPLVASGDFLAGDLPGIDLLSSLGVAGGMNTPVAAVVVVAGAVELCEDVPRA